MSFFGQKKKKGFDWGAAALAFLSPSAGKIYAQRKEDRRKHGEDLLEELNLRSSLEREGLPQHVIDGLMSDPKRIAELLTETYKVRQYTSAGGSAHNPVTGSTYQAPWREQVGSSIIQGGENGAPPRAVYEGVQPVSVDGVGVFGMTGSGRVVNGEGYNPFNPGPPPAPGGELPPGWRFEDEGGPSPRGSGGFSRFPF